MNRIAFQGEPGAYSHLACREFTRDQEPLPCPTFEDALAAVASSLAAEIYGLATLRADIEDDPRNTTRFVALAREPRRPAMDAGQVITTLLFEVRNVPAALYKALGGFATNGVNLTKIESYQRIGSFRATPFYADLEGHPEQPHVRRALEELAFFTSRLVVLGVYAGSAHREALDA